MRAVVFGIAVAAAASAAQAQERQTLGLSQGLQAVVTFREAFSSASVGDPEIIDALPRSDRTLIVAGRKAGTSDILVFIDGKPLYQITVNVTGPATPGKVFNHNQRNLGEYTAYSCNPICTRADDKFESKQVLILGPGGAITGATTSGNNIIPAR